MTVAEILDKMDVKEVKALQKSGYLSATVLRDRDIYRKYVVERTKHKSMQAAVKVLEAQLNLSYPTVFYAIKRINSNCV